MKILRSLFRFVLFALLCFVLHSLWQVIIYRYIPPLYTWHMVGVWIEQGSVEYAWLPMDDISPWMGVAVIAAEDQKFPEHNGFDIEAIKEEIEKRRKGQGSRGASTISQQVSKNLFLWHGKNFFRKGLEAYYTVLIEMLWPKERILEVYLNIAQMGPDVFGVKKASEQYFKREAQDISIQQAALLAAVLPNPVRFSAAQPSSYINRRKNWIVQQSYQIGGKKILQNL
ncbi:monofunctional biosynthetic peptidoglycan transglycosylase [Roseivirga sp. BDSF3-8]|uniref:monofunctional biosynthetic peptidoglycan transglycosylase n=1 Tax=Roseivirga sp. BDSF3-8 TaxID=3241598 RepID=UPI0035325F9A